MVRAPPSRSDCERKTPGHEWGRRRQQRNNSSACLTICRRCLMYIRMSHLSSFRLMYLLVLSLISSLRYVSGLMVRVRLLHLHLWGTGLDTGSKCGSNNGFNPVLSGVGGLGEADEADPVAVSAAMDVDVEEGDLEQRRSGVNGTSTAGSVAGSLRRGRDGSSKASARKLQYYELAGLLTALPLRIWLHIFGTPPVAPGAFEVPLLPSLSPLLFPSFLPSCAPSLFLPFFFVLTYHNLENLPSFDSQ